MDSLTSCKFSKKDFGCSTTTGKKLVNKIYDTLSGSIELFSDDGDDNLDDDNNGEKRQMSSLEGTNALFKSMELKQLTRRVSRSFGPHHRFWCPLSKMIMSDPVVTPQLFNFERKEILKLLDTKGEICPLSGQPLRASDLKANNKLQWEILYWQRKHGGCANYSLDELVLAPINRVDAALDVVSRKKVDAPPSVPRKENRITKKVQGMDPEENKLRKKNLLSRRYSFLHPSILDTQKEDSPPFVPRRKTSKMEVERASPSPWMDFDNTSKVGYSCKSIKR